MNKLFMLSISYIRKSKDQTISFLLIIILGAMLLNIGLVTLIDYNNLFTKKYQELNTADAYFVMNESQYSPEYYDYVKNQELVSQCELVDVVLQMGEFSYGQSILSKINIFLNAEKETAISKIKWVEKADIIPDHPIYVPFVLKASAHYKLGDTFEIKTAHGSDSYHIAGFFEEMMTGTSTSKNMGFMLNEEDFNQLKESENGIYKAKMINVKLYDQRKAPVFLSQVNNYMSVEFPTSSLRSSASIDYIKFAKTGISNIGSYVIIVFSMLIVIISLILTHFRIKNTIEGDMKTIGALKALGYTSSQLIASFILQFTLLSGMSCIAGVALSYGLLPFIRDIFTSASGMVWSLSFQFLSSVLTLFIIILSSGTISYLGCRRIKKLPPITALRGGLVTHSFQKNVIPFDKKCGNLTILMSSKLFLQELKQNIMILVIVSAVFFQMAFGFVFYHNMVVDEKNFIDLVAGEQGDASIQLNPNNYDKNLLSKLQKETAVRKAFYYDSQVFITFDEKVLLNGAVNLCKDYSINETSNVYKGRNPVHDNEAALSGITAKDMDKKIGDLLRLTVGGISYEYLITGFLQDGNGTNTVQMTYDAYKRLVPAYQPSNILIYLHEKESVPSFLEYISKKYEDRISHAKDSKELIYSIIRPMIEVMKLSLYVIILATFSIIALILKLIIKTNIVRRRTELGIQKSIGFTTFQLMLQNTLSLLPAFFAGSVLGGILSKLFMNQMAQLTMRAAGILKVSFEIQTAMLLAMGIGILIFSFAVSMFLSFKLRKITVYSLISE